MIEWDEQTFHEAIAARIDLQAHALGRFVVREAEINAPKRTGRLATSISYTYDNATHELDFIVGAPYGIFVEYGTRNMGPIPYLRPALNAAESIYGFETQMTFANTPYIVAPLLASGPKFHKPRGRFPLTAKQERHVDTVLTPRSEMHWVGNVSRTKMRVKRF